MADKLLQDVYRKIEREKVLINGARAMRQSTDNAAVQQRLDNQIRESQRNLSYLEGRYGELQNMVITSGVDNMHVNDGGGYGGGYQNPQMLPPNKPFAQGSGGSAQPKTKPNYSKLDLIKYDTPHLGPRIQLMLSQLEFKLSVEKQYKEGIEKMIKLYQMEGDRKSRQDAESKHTDSGQKIQLLKQALKRYEDLHVDMDFGDEADDDSINSPNIRRPLTGRLAIRVLAVKDVDHATTPRFTRGPETFVIIKVEDVARVRTKSTRNDKWLEETHDIDVDKANEIEMTVYDKPGDSHMPIGLLWIRISDIAEELRRKKIEQEISSSGWVSADKMANSGGAGRPGEGAYNYNQGFGGPAAAGGGNAGMYVNNSGQAQAQSGSAGIDAWFALEPVGQIHLNLNFVKYNRNKRPLDLGLGRKGAVRARKEEVHEMYGHKFVQQQFYNIMRCALCSDFLKYSAGMQCSDCKYTCHKKCYPKVVTKCISKSNAETDPEEEKLNHRIPHRFEPMTNMGANWCCHCGYMLPVGKKNARKCTECGLTCHSQCAHLVPDFCGMSMEVANQILGEIKKTKRQRPSMADRNLRTNVPSAPSSPLSGRPTSEPYVSHLDPRNSVQGEPAQLSQRTHSYTPSSPTAVNAASVAYGSAPSPARPQQPAPYSPEQRPNRVPDPTAVAAAAHAGHRPPSTVQSQTGYPPRQSADFYQGAPTSPTQTKHHGAELPSSPSPYQQGQGYDNPYQQHRTSISQQSPAAPPKVPPASTGYGQPQPVGYDQRQSYGQTHPPAPAKVVPPAHAYPEKQKLPPPPAPEPPQQIVSKPTKIGLDHFNFLAVLGKGNFGKVMLAETKASKKLYAIKVLKKEFIIENDEVESTRSEKRVFLVANKERHPFLLNLHACFQTETRVYFVMEYISGGDLMLHIQRGPFGSRRAQFYAAEVCLALKYFHENGVIYRDLKLDNILLTLDGHIKIADYGLCKEEMWYGSSTSTFCGTPEFMAPEILMDKRYGRAVDWWAFGVLIYQMLLQQSPFRGEDEDEIYDAILADEALYPIHMPRDSVSILQKLLTKEPELRLGSGPTDAQEIMSHPFFANINWEDIHHKRIPPPFKPSIQSATDTSNFDQEFTSVTPVLTPVQSVLTQAMQEEFRGFSYVQDFS
ncbi:protein kinase C [Choiromyces venosus 120613-1]|uniref:protein kinase C n=1 Tax=Choiromyces venosus 120613-1 TaxID=1336337 RepID=A0A3N4K909_9PEZI|nr:protein kinase C [Choiromyces venosus 120613-1]